MKAQVQVNKASNAVQMEALKAKHEAKLEELRAKRRTKLQRVRPSARQRQRTRRGRRSRGGRRARTPGHRGLSDTLVGYWKARRLPVFPALWRCGWGRCDAPRGEQVGYSKERRVDPQVVVGLLVDRRGFPLEIGCYEGNKAETQTIIPIVKQFAQPHGLADMVVVADAGMLSASNLRDFDEAGLRFIVGSRVTKAR